MPGGEQTVKHAENGSASPIWHSENGKSRLFLGDSLAFMEQLPADSVDCIWTDPPYLLSNDVITCVAGKMVKVNKGEWDRSRGVDLDHEFTQTWLAAYHRIHPTQKPIALIARCLRATTDPGDLVFDPFTGSGSTGVAALKLGRHFVGCEQDKIYAKLASNRLTDAAGGDVEIDTGASRPTTPNRQHGLFAKA